MTALQIVFGIILLVGALVAIGFFVAGMITLFVEKKEEVEEV